jgi:alpha-1,3-rhamnosyl/mannosyltransferase
LNLLLNTESLRPPLTGIGNYTLNLLLEFSKNSSVDSVSCFNGKNWIGPEAQLAQLANPNSNNGGEDIAAVITSKPTEVSERSSYVSNARKVIRRVPGAFSLYQSLLQHRSNRSLSRHFTEAGKGLPRAVYHEPNYILRPFPGPSVATIHDLSFIHYPQFHPKERVDWLGKQLPKSLNRADFVITDSNIVREELIDLYGLSGDRVKAIHLGADARFMPRSEEQTEQALSSLGLRHKRYVLFVGTLDPRKGVDVLLDAWCQLPRDVQLEFPLVLAGSLGWRNGEVMKKIESLVAKGDIHHLQYVPDEQLPQLYSGAALFAYPSIYEGFGLPVLEAMASGVPVIFRSNTSMAEFAGDSGLICESGTAEELAMKMSTVLTDEGLQSSCVEKGLIQSAKYSWAQCAKETADVYRLIS